MSDAPAVKEEGLKLYRAGRYEDAAAKFAEAQLLFASVGNAREVAECANNRGVCWRQAAKFEEATAAFEEARPLFQSFNDLVGEGQVVGNLAAVVESQGDKQHAAELYQEAIDLFTQAGAKDFAKDTYTALSKIKLKQRDVVGAMTAFDAGLEQLDKPNLIERMARKIIGGGSSAHVVDADVEDAAASHSQDQNAKND
jgi:tetratricopeptide (TPR) repeat protein